MIIENIEVEKPKRKISRVPQPKGNIDTYNKFHKNKVRVVQIYSKEVLRSLTQFEKYSKERSE